MRKGAFRGEDGHRRSRFVVDSTRRTVRNIGWDKTRAIGASEAYEAYLSKMDFVKHDFSGEGDLIESSNKSQHGDNGQGQPIIPFWLAFCTGLPSTRGERRGISRGIGGISVLLSPLTEGRRGRGRHNEDKRKLKKDRKKNQKNPQKEKGIIKGVGVRKERSSGRTIDRRIACYSGCPFFALA